MPKECYVEISGITERDDGSVTKHRKVYSFPSVELAKEFIEQVAWEDHHFSELNVVKTKDGTCCRSFNDALTFDVRMTILMKFSGIAEKATPKIYPEYNPYNLELLKAFGVDPNDEL